MRLASVAGQTGVMLPVYGDDRLTIIIQQQMSGQLLHQTSPSDLWDQSENRITVIVSIVIIVITKIY